MCFNEKCQYHGGTNFGRSAGGPFITTSYDYDAPIDEYGEQTVLIMRKFLVGLCFHQMLP